jgi:hypothetical protein
MKRIHDRGSERAYADPCGDNGKEHERRRTRGHGGTLPQTRAETSAPQAF